MIVAITIAKGKHLPPERSVSKKNLSDENGPNGEEMTDTPFGKAEIGSDDRGLFLVPLVHHRKEEPRLGPVRPSASDFFVLLVHRLNEDSCH